MKEYPVKTYIADNAALVIPEKEAARYLGYGGHPVSEEDLVMIREGITQVKAVVAGKACYCRYGIRVNGDEIELPYGTVKSTHLGKWIEGCDEAYFFAATIGSGFDRLIRRTSLTSMAKGAVLQACGAAAVEAICDEINRVIDEEAAAEGRKTRRRYSPGYGDFALENQKGFFAVLNPAKYIGLTLMDTLIMSPEKSVTALIGVEREEDRSKETGWKDTN